VSRRVHRQPDARSPWLIGLAQIADYAQIAERTVNDALLSGELDGRQRRARGTWRSRPEWVDAWIDSFDSAATESHLTREHRQAAS
jgi:hypothetical protein